jgi:hypothetical protein
MTEKVLKDRFHCSADELEHRMQVQAEQREEPVKKAVELLDMALEKVLTKLGVNISLGAIPDQQHALGITICEEVREEMAGVMGFYIYVGYEDVIPYAWIGAARLEKDGNCYVDIQYFQDNRLEETGGVKLI